MTGFAPQPIAEELRPFEHLIDFVNEFSPLTWRQEGEVLVRRAGAQYALTGNVVWTGQKGTANLRTTPEASRGLRIIHEYGRTMRDEDFFTIQATNGAWHAGKAYVVEFHTRYDGEEVSEDVRLDFLELKLGDAQAVSTSNALLIADVDFLIYPTPFPVNRDRLGFSADGMVAQLFGRPAIIRRLPGPKSQEPFLMVAYDGELLDDEQKTSLRLLLSFLTGRAASIAGEFGINGDREAWRVLTSYTPNDSPLRPPIKWWAPYPALQAIRDLPERLPHLLEEMRRLLVDEDLPIEAALGHLLPRMTYVDLEIRDVALALDTLIEADAFNRDGVTVIAADQYAKLLPEIEQAVTQVVYEHAVPADLLDHILERLRGANDTSHSARRRAFFDRIGFTPGPAERNALKLRHPAAHRGYLWRTRDGLDQLDELTRQTKIARSFVNSVILSLLGYRGVVLDYVLDANVSPATLRQR